MWHLFDRPKYAVRDLLNVSEDFHSHILPSVDDGCATWEDSMEALDYYEALGMSKVVLTPHIMDRYPENHYDVLTAKFADFQNRYRGHLHLRLGAEYMIDCSIYKHLEEGQLLTVKDEHVLVELPLRFPLLNYTHIMEDIMNRGYFIVLAHPERYAYLKMKQFDNLQNMGVKFQLNLLSFAGMYGEGAKEQALTLLQNDFYDLWGTDYHKHSAQLFMEKRCLKESNFEKLIQLKEKIRADL